jgi:hypothetical protein
MGASTKKRSTTKKWSAGVTTSSTHPPDGLFTKRAAVIAQSLASKKVSPKGPASGLRMLTFYINRAGKELTEDRRAELEKAKRLLSDGFTARRTGRHRMTGHESAKVLGLRLRSHLLKFTSGPPGKGKTDELTQDIDPDVRIYSPST